MPWKGSSYEARETKAGYTQADLDVVSDNPEWTEATTARSKSFSETFSDIERQGDRGQNTPTKRQITLRLDERVIDHFKAKGEGWQSRVNEAFKKAAGL